mmetsp:Transcript_6639/g.11173  ORF Transcript_6639/g.11173 Transcript_6639/m.11173 type:complete len:236 (+) Transcript_6639:445-1152(+)
MVQGGTDQRARSSRLHHGSQANHRLLQQDGRQGCRLQGGQIQRDQGRGQHLPQAGRIQDRHRPLHPHLGLERRQHARALPQHDLVQGTVPARGPRRHQAPQEAHPQAPETAPAGRLQDLRYRNRPRRKSRDWSHQARHLLLLRTPRNHHRYQVRRDAPRAGPGGHPRRQRRLQRQGTLRHRYQERLRRLRRQERARQGHRVVQGPGHRHEPPRPDHERILARARLPHLPHRLQVR